MATNSKGDEAAPQTALAKAGSLAHRFFFDTLASRSSLESFVIRLVIPRIRGQIIRSDIIEGRLLGCEVVTAVSSLADPLQFFDGEPVQCGLPEAIPKALASAAGAILLGDITDFDSRLHTLDEELQNRLSFHWISPKRLERKTLALVEGGRRDPNHGGNGETVFKAAYAFGIDMVVLDNPGHWLQGPQWARWRTAFLAMECGLQSDAVFTQRVVDTIRAWGGHLDGLTTFCDHYKEPVAEAALILGLPTQSPLTYALATDKFRLRRFEGSEAHLANDVDSAIAAVKDHDLKFPLIIKPVTGYLSEGVTRVENLDQLKVGVKTIDAERHGTAFAIEQYCEGPEVDANFVLAGGDLLFFEVSDEFPKGADVNSHGHLPTFIELGNVIPSKLPAVEVSALRDHLYRSLIRLGFTDGVFHLEARVQHSSMAYVVRDSTFDLYPCENQSGKQPSAWLIEVNPRPPAQMESDAIKHTYGIDYWGLAVLFGIHDQDRVAALSHPFAQGAQYWCQMVFIPAEKGGIYDTEDACGELLERRPELKTQVSWCANYFSKGATVPDPGSGINAWVAHLNVFSRESRRRVLELGEIVRQHFRYSIL
ncbi:hypothetical protein KVT40_003613 [Elsinoe batatas]|uniref:ATP-grasp domain-containing protein n=1 Tax=Elsinoe batatas TaxID=2601811 RepID=A0A8K0L2H8_9PEZI|nr:hypothetical protein KVT40_003613 [Elsinoe batatas]